MNAKHGTYAGWNQHMVKRTPVCLGCKEAARQYQAARRAENPEAYAREKAANYARDRALRRLAKLHPGDYARLVFEESAKDRVNAS